MPPRATLPDDPHSTWTMNGPLLALCSTPPRALLKAFAYPPAKRSKKKKNQVIPQAVRDPLTAVAARPSTVVCPRLTHTRSVPIPFIPTLSFEHISADASPPKNQGNTVSSSWSASAARQGVVSHACKGCRMCTIKRRRFLPGVRESAHISSTYSALSLSPLLCVLTIHSTSTEPPHRTCRVRATVPPCTPCKRPWLHRKAIPHVMRVKRTSMCRLFAVPHSTTQR
jgi:hypothetical protein